MTAVLVFWSMVAILFYTYAGYHLLLRLAVFFVPRADAGDSDSLTSPLVTIVVAVHNEERVIAGRVENLLHLDYPREKLEVIVASDGSTDRTNEIAQSYRGQGITVLELHRMGKGPAQDVAVASAKGEIVILTDADTVFRTDFVRAVTGHFSRAPRVGGVAANLKWKIDSASNPPSRMRELSWRLETDLRETESRLGLLASASGAAMAFRKELWRPMRQAINDSDSLTPLDIILKGYRVFFARDAVAYEVPFTSSRSDFRAKVRGVSKSVIMIPRRWRARDWVGHPLIAWRTVSHHLLRWLAPYAMLAAMLSSLFLFRQGAVYQMIVLTEIALAVLAVAGYVSAHLQRPLAVACIFSSFLVINAGFALGFLKGMIGAAQGQFETE